MPHFNTKQPVIIDGVCHWRCSQCKRALPPDAFNKDRHCANGLTSNCRECRQANKKARRLKDRERNAEYRRENAEHRLNYNRRYIAEHRRERRARDRRYYIENKDAFNAKMAVRQAIKSGELVKPDICEMCGARCALDGHHDSYESDRRLVVTWLCRRCHRFLHARISERLAAEERHLTLQDVNRGQTSIMDLLKNSA